MITKHLGDTEIQNYALQHGNYDAAVTMHVTQCSVCRQKVVEYQQLFKGIEAQNTEEFDFDLAEVVSRAIRPKPRFSLSIYFPVFLALALLAVVFYEFALSGVNIISDPFIAISCIATIVFIVVQNAGLFKNHQKAMDLLNAC
jgi:hypothetical protein